MSYQAVQWALDDAPMLRMPGSGRPDTTARGVLIARAERADNEGRDTHAGIEDIVWRTGYDERTIQRAERRLEDAKLLIRDGTTRWGTPRWNLNMTLQRDPAERAAIEAEAGKERAANAERERSRRAKKATKAEPRVDAESARADAESTRADVNDARVDAESPEPPMNRPGTAPEPPTGGAPPPDPRGPEAPTGLRTEQPNSLSVDQDQPLETVSNHRPHARENEDGPAELCPHGQDPRRRTANGDIRCKPCRTAPPVDPGTPVPTPGPCGTPGCVRGYIQIGDALPEYCTVCNTQPAAATRRGPDPDETVWIAIARKGVDAHRLDPIAAGTTSCSRSTHAGITVPAESAARQLKAQWCLRCWPDTTEQP